MSNQSAAYDFQTENLCRNQVFCSCLVEMWLAAKHMRHVAEQTGQKLPGSRRWFGGGQKPAWKLPASLQYFAEVHWHSLS